MSAPHDIYTEQLSERRRGSPLYYPEPHSEDGAVEIGDVGYIKHGAFYRLFNVARLPDDPAQRFGVPDDFEHLDMGFIRTFKGALQPGPVHSKTVCTLEADIGTQCGILPAEASFHFKCTSNRGAILMLETEMSREEAVQTARFERYLRRHCLSFHAFAKSLDITLGFGDLMLVTECSKTAAWSSAVYADSDREFGLGFSVGRPFLPSPVGFSAAAGVQRIGSVDRRRSQQRALPGSPPLPNDHTVFLKAFRLGTREAYVQSTVSLFMKARDSFFGERRGDARSKKARRSSASGGSTPPSPTPPSIPRAASYSDIVVMRPDDSDYHPSIPLLGLAMEASDSDCAIIHDDVWCSARVDSEESQIIKEYAEFHFSNDVDFYGSSMPDACGVVDERTAQRLSMLAESEHVTTSDSDDSYAGFGSEIQNQQVLRESLWSLNGSVSVPGGWNPYEDEVAPSDYTSEDELVDQLRRLSPLLVHGASWHTHEHPNMEPCDRLREGGTQSIGHDSGSGQEHMSEEQDFEDGATQDDLFSAAKRYPCVREEISKVTTIWTCTDQKQPILWVHGPAGAGKCAIVRTVAEHLAERDISASSFFISRERPGRNYMDPLFDTIAYRFATSMSRPKIPIQRDVFDDPFIVNQPFSFQLQKPVVERLQTLTISPGAPPSSDIIPSLAPLLITDTQDESDDANHQRKASDRGLTRMTVVSPCTVRSFFSVLSSGSCMRQPRFLREKESYIRSQDPEVGHSFSTEHAPSHSPHVIRSSLRTPSTHTYSNAKQLPQAFWDTFRSSPGSKNNILLQAIKAFDAAQTLGGGNDPASVWITSGSAFKSPTVPRSFVRSYPVSMFPPLAVDTAVDTLAEDYIRSSMFALASALRNAMPSHRVYSIFATEPVTRMFAEEWTRLTGIRKHADDPYYAAKSSYRTTRNLKIQSPGSDLNSLGDRLRPAVSEDLPAIELCFSFADESFPFRMDRSAAEQEAALLVEKRQVWVHEVRGSDNGQPKDIASIVVFTGDSDNIAPITKVYTNPRWRRRECAERPVRDDVCELPLSAPGRRERIVPYTPQDDWTITDMYRSVGLVQLAEQAEVVEVVDSGVGIGLDGTAVDFNAETYFESLTLRE